MNRNSFPNNSNQSHNHNGNSNGNDNCHPKAHKNVKKHKKNNKSYTKIKADDKIMLIPQYNKYVNIYNQPLGTNFQPAPVSNQPLQPNRDSGAKVSRIVIKRPVNKQSDQENMEDTMLNSIMASLLSGSGGSNMFSLDRMINNSEKKPKIEDNKSTEPVIPLIDYENMMYIDECPRNLDDLLDIINKVGTKYDVTKYYNLDLARLKNIQIPLEKLKKMVGLEEVKSRIVDIILYYLQRLDVKNCDLLHTIIDGAPGTGKTEIAHIYSEILVGLGILTKNIFKKAKKHDLIGGYLGHTAMKTMKLLEEVKGGVLFIDEIYSFGSSEGKDSKDIYAKEFIDLLMQFMSENKSDFVLVVAGYKEDISKFFLSMNDGLERRFPIHLSIGEYSPSEMRKIFLKKSGELHWDVVEDNDFYDDFFDKNKEYFKYYGGDMEILLSKCKYSHSRNLIEDHSKKHRVITRKDFLDGFDLFKKNPEIEERKKTGKYLSYYL
jgi:hypothetical protein